jgi:hypothetical protein
MLGIGLFLWGLGYVSFPGADKTVHKLRFELFANPI